MRFPAGEACTCENGPSFLAWKPEPAAWAGFGLRDVHVKTNGCFWSSMNAIHECVRISAAAARRRVEASTRETLISVRHFPPRHSVCTSNLAVVFGVSSVGRVHVKLDRRFRHVCPFFSLYVAAKMLHMSKFGRRFRHACLSSDASSGMHTSIWCHYVLFLRSEV